MSLRGSRFWHKLSVAPRHSLNGLLDYSDWPTACSTETYLRATTWKTVRPVVVVVRQSEKRQNLYFYYQNTKSGIQIKKKEWSPIERLLVKRCIKPRDSTSQEIEWLRDSRVKRSKEWEVQCRSIGSTTSKIHGHSRDPWRVKRLMTSWRIHDEFRNSWRIKRFKTS